MSKIAQSFLKTSAFGESKYDKMKSRDKANAPKSNALSSIILSKDKQ